MVQISSDHFCFVSEIRVKLQIAEVSEKGVRNERRQ